MRFKVELQCTGCIDGRVQRALSYEPSEVCDRCKGTALEEIALSPEDVIKFLPIDQLFINSNSFLRLQQEIQALQLRCRSMDGLDENTKAEMVQRNYSSATQAEEQRLLRLRWKFGT